VTDARAYLKNINTNQRARTSAKENPVQIQSPDPKSGSGAVAGWVSKFNGDFIVQRYIYDSVIPQIRCFFQKYKPNCDKCPISRCWSTHQKFLNRNPEADDFQNVISSFFFTDAYLAKFHEDSISSFCMKLLTDRQTDKQMPGIRLHNLLGGGKIMITRVI